MLVGPLDGPGEESFDVLVCTPAWLARTVAEHGPQVGRHRLVVEKLDLPVAETFLLRQIERLEATSWDELAATVARLGYWEFEDYRPYENRDMVTGHRAVVLIRLDEAERVRLLGGVFRPGSRSVMFRFPVAVEHEDGDMFGAVIESLEPTSDGLLRVELWFWSDLAGIYVTPGARFEVWYVRMSGEGVVLPWSVSETV